MTNAHVTKLQFSIVPRGNIRAAVCLVLVFGLCIPFPIIVLIPYYFSMSPMFSLPHPNQLDGGTQNPNTGAAWPEWKQDYVWDFECNTKEMVASYVAGSPTGYATKQNIIDQFRAADLPKEGEVSTRCPPPTTWREETCPNLAAIFEYLPALPGQNLSTGGNASKAAVVENITAGICPKFHVLLPVPILYNATVYTTAAVNGTNGWTNVTTSALALRNRTDANGTVITELACVMQGDMTLVRLPDRCYTGAARLSMCVAPSKDQKEFFCLDPQTMAGGIFVFAFYIPVIYVFFAVNALFLLLRCVIKAAVKLEGPVGAAFLPRLCIHPPRSAAPPGRPGLTTRVAQMC